MVTGSHDSPRSFGPDLVLIERLAFGGMAEVFRARQTGAGGFERPVAVKRILPNFAADAEFRAMFESEVSLCARLQHANIVQVFSTGAFEGYLYLVMELINGHNVGRTIKTASEQKKYLPPPMSVYVASEAAKGLDHAHNHSDETGRPLNVVHRDISPQNIMISYDGQVKVVDFGIAKAADRAELTAPGQIKGKVAYMSPEQIRGERLDGRSDVFSLGVVLWEMLAGRRLFKADNPTAATRMILETTARAPSLHHASVHPELDAIVLRALERNRDHRYATALDLHKDLTAFLARRYAGYIHTNVSTVMKSLFEEQLSTEQENIKSAKAALPTVTPAHGERLETRHDNLTIADDRTPTMTPYPNEQTMHSATVHTNSFPVPTIARAPATSPPVWIYGVILVAVLGVVAFVLGRDDATAHLPTDLPGLTAWYRASTVGLQPETPVAQWPDSGPLRVDAEQADIARQPRFFPGDGTNSQPFVRFDGVDDFMTADGVAIAFRRAQGLTALWVARLRQPRTQYVWSLHGEDRLRDVMRGGYNASGQMRSKTAPRGGTQYADADHRTSLDRFGVYVLVVTEGELRMYVDGQNVYDSTFPEPLHFFDSKYFSVGQEWDREGPSDFLAGDISELILYERSLDNGERRSLERYLSEVHGIDVR